MSAHLPSTAGRQGDPAGPDELLLRDLIGGLTVPGPDPTVSVGLLGSPAHHPQPPTHCLRVCLGGDPGAIRTRGCEFLRQAAENAVETTSGSEMRCHQGFRVAAQRTSLGGLPATLMTVEGDCRGRQATADAARAERHAAGGEGHAALLGHLDTANRLVQRIGQILEENSGFADEVLRSYEQLNLIFDLTQQIASVPDPRTIERLLLERLATLLATQRIWITDPAGANRAPTAAVGALDAGPLPGADIGAVVAEARATRTVQVAAVRGHPLIAGPLVRLDEHVDVVAAARPAGTAAFTSGDMMIVESILTFGGQILSNSELHERLRRMSIEVTRALVSAIDKKDHYTSGHSERGGFLTRLTAAELGVPPAEQQTMEWAGLLHDVGKIGIPEEILCKPGKLTEAEFEVVKQHPRMGYEILKPIASLGTILDGVLYHHEYPDGSGYPEGLRGEEIPLVARIIHVADTFDALTSTRSYRKAFTIEKALEIIRSEKGVRIDAAVADAFFRAFERYRRTQPEDFEARFGETRELVDADP